MKVVLINPPSPFLINDKVHPPLGLLYVAAQIRSQELAEVEVKDLAGMGDKVPKADVYAFTATTPQYPAALGIRKLLKKVRKGRFIIGGPHASSAPQECLKDGWDTVVTGEGESAMNYYLNNPKKYQGKELYGAPATDIDQIPFPARDLIDIKSYKYKVGKRWSTTMMSSRGCPYHCAFCSKKVMVGPVRRRSPENVNAEIAEIQDKYKFNAIMFFDDIFVMDYPRLKEIAEFMKERDIIYRCFVRANLASDKMMDVLADTGCYEIGFGAESGSDDILKTIGKVTTVEMNTRLVKLAHDRGIRVKAFLIAGLPGETEYTLHQMEHWIQTAHPDDFDISILTPYPGSDIYDYPQKYDIQFDKHGSEYGRWFYKGKPNCYTPVVATKQLSASRIAELRDEIERKWKK